MPVPTPPEIVQPREHERLYLRYYHGTSFTTHLIIQGDLNNLVRDVGLSKTKAGVL